MPDHRVRRRVIGMDCAHDAAEIEAAAGAIPGVSSAKVSLASHSLTLVADDADATLPLVAAALAGLGYHLEALGASAGPDGGPPAASHLTAAYRRALWIVVILNVGYGVVEAVGGFLSGSQALKADALDFLGDGVITLFGLLAIAWSLSWRARAALLQGVFLGLLGLGVVGNTLYRILVQQAPEPAVMGVLGAVALAVNVAAALVLVPHRAGDANVRAVWLFSRNDAIGNAAVVLAALLVAVTGTAWPDLVVAALIATLFLHSSWAIIRDARTDLRAAG